MTSLTLHDVKSIKIKREFFKKDSTDSFHSLTLIVSHGNSHPDNSEPENFEINIMSKKRIFILEDPEYLKEEREFNENEEAGMRALVDDPTAWDGGFAENN